MIVRKHAMTTTRPHNRWFWTAALVCPAFGCQDQSSADTTSTTAASTTDADSGTTADVGDDRGGPVQDLPSPQPAGLDWNLFTVGAGAKPVVTATAGGTADVAFMFEADPGWLRHARFGPGATEADVVNEVATGYFYGPIGVADFADGRTGIAYHDHTLEDQVLAVEDMSGSLRCHP